MHRNHVIPSRASEHPAFSLQLSACHTREGLQNCVPHEGATYYKFIKVGPGSQQQCTSDSTGSYSSAALVLSRLSAASSSSSSESASWSAECQCHRTGGPLLPLHLHRQTPDLRLHRRARPASPHPPPGAQCTQAGIKGSRCQWPGWPLRFSVCDCRPRPGTCLPGPAGA